MPINSKAKRSDEIAVDGGWLSWRQAIKCFPGTRINDEVCAYTDTSNWSCSKDVQDVGPADTGMKPSRVDQIPS